MTTNRLTANWFCFLILVFMLTSTIDIKAQDNSTGRRQFYNIIELTKLIQRAREAGFSEEELKNLEIKDSQSSVNLKEYMTSILNKRRVANENLQRFLKKKFITVQDVYNEMVKLEPNTLNKLREELISER